MLVDHHTGKTLYICTCNTSLFFSCLIRSRTASSMTWQPTIVSQIWRCSSRRYGCIIDTVPSGHISCSSKRGGFPAFLNHQLYLDTEWGHREKCFCKRKILQGWSRLNCYPYWSSGDHAGLWWIIKPCNDLLISVCLCALPYLETKSFFDWRVKEWIRGTTWGTAAG